MRQRERDRGDAAGGSGSARLQDQNVVAVEEEVRELVSGDGI